MNTQRDQNAKKTTNSALDANGIGFENQAAMHIKFTHKDLLLVAGVVVALIIAFSTWVWGAQSQDESRRLLPTPKISQQVLHKIGNTLINRF